MTEEELFLSNAADMLRRSVETFNRPFSFTPEEIEKYPPCDLFGSLLGLNNSYFLHLYKYIENQSFITLAEKPHVTDNDLRNALQHQCEKYWRDEIKSAPFAYPSKHAGFMYDFGLILNSPFFTKEMEKPRKDLAMEFTQALWQNYKKNWNAIRPL